MDKVYYTDSNGRVHEYDSYAMRGRYSENDGLRESTNAEINMHLQIKGLERGITELYSIVIKITEKLGIEWGE